VPIISDPSRVKEIYTAAAERGVCLADFCTANPYTTEAILRATSRFGQRHGVKAVPIILSATANYPIEPQLQHYTATGDAIIGLHALVNDVEILLSPGSPYANVQVMLHLDHAQPDLDETVVELALAKFASIMYDCSALPLEENIRRTAQFVEAHRNQVLVEGAVAEIAQATDAEDPHELTDPAVAERYLQETGVFLLVPDLGTEHRATAAVARYDAQRARAISARVGKRLVLHGSSSLQDEELSHLAADGIIKVNIWTIFERLGAQAVARQVVEDLGNILTQAELETLHESGYLGDRYFDQAYIDQTCSGALGPKTAHIVEVVRREAWMAAVMARMEFYLEAFGYARLT